MQIACGIAQKRYAFPNVSQKTYTTVKYAVKTMSSLSDVIIFLFLGIVTISHKHEWHTGFALWTLGLCTVARYQMNQCSGLKKTQVKDDDKVLLKLWISTLFPAIM